MRELGHRTQVHGVSALPGGLQGKQGQSQAGGLSSWGRRGPREPCGVNGTNSCPT